MGVHVPVKPELISWALDQAQTTPAQFKDKDRDHVESWLDGKQQPTLKQLQDFARRVHVPFGYLMLSEPPALEKPLPDFRRRSAAAGRYSQELTEEIYIQQRRQNWFREYALEYGLPAVSWAGSAERNDNPQDVAQRLRREWNFTTLDSPQKYPVSRKEIFGFLEDLGVLVSVAGYVGLATRRVFDVQEFSGFSLFDEYAPVVFVNGRESAAAQIFTMLHELGHLVLGESGVSDSVEDSASSSHPDSERWCDEFAAAFLMPAIEVEQAFSGDLSEDTMLHIARRFRVSVLSLLNRLRDLRLLSFSDWEAHYPEFERRAFEVLQDKAESNPSGGNFYKTHAFTVGRRFARAVYRDAKSGRTSYADAHQLVGLPKVETYNRFAREVAA